MCMTMVHTQYDFDNDRLVSSCTPSFPDNFPSSDMDSHKSNTKMKCNSEENKKQLIGNNHQVINENTTHQVSHLVNRADIIEAEECSNTIMMYSDFESNIDIGDYREEWNINVSPFEEPLHILVTSQVGEDVVDSNTTYHSTISQETIFSSIMDTRLLDHEDFFVFSKEGEECLYSLEELVSYIE
ncbi:hypothetical protein Tco_1525633 [Tanacetum coccineum]